ncbi:AraC family transcriptional regulator [Ktedonosporobacter rubrisoli]|uniref:AraC family transcriptional regulator n=1 Tax=Ktedonosporobacter rubrisoli TaxID=2509675 RepID=A0A4P6JQH9_KTERU|nr:AraC family transcriptional regulator [Ktedonosporobacter rubrisoli]QBD77585.1 AraC family transcriptional regulator [Ktedonosporobacter rubrisoli]
MMQATVSQENKELPYLDCTVMLPLSAQPIAVPKRASWKFMALEHHRQPPAECSYSLPIHKMRIALQPYLSFEHRVNDGRVSHLTVARGDLAVCPAHSLQWMRWQEDAEFLLLSIQPALLERFAEEAEIEISSIELIETPEEFQDPLIYQLGLTLLTELSAESTIFSAAYIDALSNALAAHILKHFCLYSHKKSLVPASTKLSSTAWRNVVEYIHTHLDQALTLKELATIVGMSSYHFAHSFKQALGISPHQYILRLRIEYAKMMLLKGEVPLSEIVMHLGFADQSHFTRSFKRVVGIPPRMFVQEHRKNVLS